MKRKRLSDFNWSEIQVEHDSKIPLLTIQRKYGISRTLMDTARSNGLLIKRNFPRLHSRETKIKLSSVRKKYLADNPDKHPWKKNTKFKSQPCEYFKTILKDNNISFYEEYTPLDERYFSIDIAFPCKKIGIEINGNQHYDREGNLLSYYQQRHDDIVNSGWELIEIHYLKVYDKLFITEFLDKFQNMDLENLDIICIIKETRQEKQERKRIERENCKNVFVMERRKMIENLDLNKFGIYVQIGKLWNITSQKVKPFIKKHMPDLYKQCYTKMLTVPPTTF